MPKTKWFASALTLLGAALAAQTPPTETVLFNFAALPDGKTPYAGVVADTEGNLYGTACDGGPYNRGVVYKVNTAGKETVLYNFKGGSSGGCPQGGVILDGAGNLYGTAEAGGAGHGLVYQVNAAGQETVLYNFTGGADGANPKAALARDAAGNLYGTTEHGGNDNGDGVVFKLDTTGHETVLHTFTGGADGSRPFTGVTLDAAGNLYGTTPYGGSNRGNCSHLHGGCGVVFKLDPSGHDTVLYTFTGGADGAEPFSSVVLDAAGNIYGATWVGGTGDGWGVVYELDTTGHETALYSFPGGTAGANPYGPLTRDSAGNLYGTTEYGGTTGCGNGCGVVYRVDAAGQEKVRYTFTGGTDGANPTGGVIRDASGNLYGTTQGGGPANLGAVFKVDAAGNETALDAFTGGLAGDSPQSGLIRDGAGNFYGTTYYGGPANDGVFYKVDTAGHETVLFSFTGANGANPAGNLARDAAGNIYGTTTGGTTEGAVVLYKVDATGQETVVFDFGSGASVSGVVSDAAGNLYGTGYIGGASHGLVYKRDTTLGYMVLYTFTGGADGGSPYGGVILGADGNLYGTASGGGAAGHGVVYEISPSGQETVLYNFTGGADGGYPEAGVIRDSTGNFYGTTASGGAAGLGTVFKLDPSGQETVLYSFMEVPAYPPPYSSLALDAAGNLYGTTYSSEGTACGDIGCGTVYQVDPSGQYTLLYSFTGGTDGATPTTPVLVDGAGHLFGTASARGKRDGGVLFKITL